MHSTLVVTFVGPDRPGLVDAFARRVREHGGNWEASRLARLGGCFTGMLLVRVPAERVEALEGALRLAVDGFTVLISRGDGAERAVTEHVLTLACADRTGIVHELTAAIASLGANIEELESRVRCAPMSGEPTFSATVRVSMPEGRGVDALVAALEGLSPDLMVELQ